ncbi:MAG: VOC family protein [Verrucomicrobiales bacterium]|nr:VOC family protein [Verrucomicrobiales bacterium]
MGINVTQIPFVAYPVSDLTRARDFYERVIGLKCTLDHELTAEGQRWIEYDIGDCALAISNAWQSTGESGAGAAFEVTDLDTALEILQTEKVNIKTDVMESPGCRFFIITDPDGNDITIHQHK